METETSKEEILNEEVVGELQPDKPFEFPATFDEFVNVLAQFSTPEEKLQYAIGYMEKSLSQNGSPNFKNFWESRKICLEIFKENIPLPVRSVCWDRYRDLSKEARNLKEILDEQSAFAVEQIEIAIVALETNTSQTEIQIRHLPPALENLSCIENQYQIFNDLQRELNFLNAEASRVNALRKELIKTDMRIRHKNKFFQRLSSVGDRIFPRRKELIKEVSHLFIGLVEDFIAKYFDNDAYRDDSLFFVRDQIKDLQSLAKVLTLNTQAFNQTRTKLSSCWDKVKVLEKEQKKTRFEKREVFQSNYLLVKEKITDVATKVENEELTVDQIQSSVAEISSFMRSLELGKEDVRFLRGELNAFNKIIEKKLTFINEEKLLKEQEKEKIRQKRITDIKERIDKLIQSVECTEIDEILAEKEALIKEIQNPSLSKFERYNFERLLKPVKDVIADKREQALCKLSDDERDLLKNLKDLLNERRERCKEIKEQIEVYRKAKGSSLSDFEQALSCSEQLNSERERLEKVNHGILEIQQKIAQLEEKFR